MPPAPASNPAIQCPSPIPPRPGISHVIFDFDGTLSWLRHGWPRLMFELFRPYYPARPGETETAIHDLLLSEILSLNGKQSIFQMLRFCERVRRRGGACPAPEDLLREYQSRLDAVIARRVRALQNGRAVPDDFVVCGARAFLDKLRRRGLRLIILSGTLEPRVREEARWLGLDGYFGRHIYGGTADPAQFSKKLVIDRLLAEEAISGSQMVSFGDGPVEIDALVSDLLASSRLDFSTLSRTKLDASAVVLRALERSDVDPAKLVVEGQSPSFEADPTLIARALANLLDNAKQHAGGVETVRIAERDGSLVLEVEDSGPGFDPGDEERAFEPFYRGARQAEAEARSMGLGLALVKRIAAAHGGRATARNRPQGGACVGIELPL